MKHCVKFTCDRYLLLQPLYMLQKDDLLQWERGGCKPEMDMVVSGKFWICRTPFFFFLVAV